MDFVTTIATAEIAVGEKNGILETGSIGSCVVITLYDGDNEIGGIAHAMLPSSHNHVEEDNADLPPAKYVDKAVENLIKAVTLKGSNRNNIVAKLVGGASMFRMLQSGASNIGNQNIEAARAALSQHGIPIKNEDTGGNTGKLVRLHLNSGIVEVYTKL